MITQRMMMSSDDAGYEELNGFELKRSSNGVATTIRYHWPTSSGGLGEIRKMEVIDAAYRNTSIAYAPSSAYNYDNTALTNFSSAGNDGSWYIYNNTSYSYTTALTSVFTNSLICSQWRNLYSDKTAKENTDAWMANSYFNKSGYAPYWTRSLTVDGGNWDIPNEFQLMVIFCCSDLLDEMDPTFSSNKSKGLGYKATNGRFRMNTTYARIWSSTESSSDAVRYVGYTGNCLYVNKTSTYGVVPIREL